MKIGDTMMAVFCPVEGVLLSETQKGFIGKELEWKVRWPDTYHKGHFMLAPLGEAAKSVLADNHNTVSSAFLVQTQILNPAAPGYKLTQLDLDILDDRIAKIKIRRDALAGKLFVRKKEVETTEKPPTLEFKPLLHKTNNPLSNPAAQQPTIAQLETIRVALKMLRDKLDMLIKTI